MCSNLVAVLYPVLSRHSLHQHRPHQVHKPYSYSSVYSVVASFIELYNYRVEKKIKKWFTIKKRKFEDLFHLVFLLKSIHIERRTYIYVCTSIVKDVDYVVHIGLKLNLQTYKNE